MILIWVLGALAMISLGLLVWQVAAGWRFPLHARQVRPADSVCPPVTVFKPVKGWDPEARTCLQSWFEQDYPGQVELLFGVASLADPICPLVEKLIAANPKVSARLLVCSSARCANRKVAKLVHLSRHASHDVWVVSDADVWVPPDFLEQTVLLLRQRQAGLVHCLYRMRAPERWATQWEAVGVNADFWSQVLQAQQCKPLDFALGAAMVTTRRHVAAAGGFESLGSLLADDYHLGRRIARAGFPLVLSPLVVTCLEPPVSWSDVWKHQMRWARTIRSCQPFPYFLSILSNLTLWSGLYWMATLVHAESRGELPIAALDDGVHSWIGWAVLGGCASMRVVAALALQHRLTGALPAPRWWGLILVKDVLQVFVWASAFLGERIDWRGEVFRVRRDGRLEEVCQTPRKTSQVDPNPAAPEFSQK